MCSCIAADYCVQELEEMSKATDAAKEEAFEALKVAGEKVTELKLCETQLEQLQEQLEIARETVSSVSSGHKGKMADSLQKMEGELTAQKAKYIALERTSMASKFSVTKSPRCTMRVVPFCQDSEH